VTELSRLLATRVRDLGLRIDGSPLEPAVRRLYEELAQRRLAWRPLCYLADEWGCPDGLPMIAIPFVLADERLRELERERVGLVETDGEIVRTLRHEAGHAFNYAYRLHATPEWRELFGDFSAPYRERYRVDPFDDRFVRYLPGWYGQKHPDEDFAETFAAWLTPELDWRARYSGWRARSKLEYVDRITAELRERPPVVEANRPLLPAEEMDVTVEEYYRLRRAGVRIPVLTFFDEELRTIFDEPSGPGDPRVRAHEWMAHSRGSVVRAIAAHTGEWTPFAASIWSWLEGRARALDLRVPTGESARALVDLTALVTALVTHDRWTDVTAL
jgi:hypothetical protein